MTVARKKTQYTAVVIVNEKIAAWSEKPNYDTIEHPEEVNEVTKIVVRAYSQSELATKIGSALDAALDYEPRDEIAENYEA